MEGEAISATIEVLLQNLINVSKEEISLIRGLQKNADKLKDTLAMIQSFLDDAQQKLIADQAVKKWLKELEAVAFDADNVLDELNYHTLSNKRKAIDPNKKKVTSCFPSLNQCLHRRQMALRIKEINTSFESIRKNAVELGLEKRLADAPAAAPVAVSETNSFTLDPIFIGRDGDVSKIVEMLTSPTKDAVSILPIVGMGGLGKTTLVRNVFNHQKTKTHFGQHIWVHVSQDFDVVNLLKKILSNLKGENSCTEAGSSEEIVLKKLQEALGAKTYLLVLDDVWNQDRQKWEDFINSWSGISSTKGNGIIVTTRNLEVGSIVKTIDVHHLNGLSQEECWGIIKDRAFRGGDIPQGIEGIGRSIATRCQGLPLAARVVGGVLRDKSHDTWVSIEQDWLSDVGGDDQDNILKILKLSFDRLPSPSLKKCFAYCSIFPKGAEIERKELIELWMAEGFLQTSDPENAGNKNFNHLLQHSLLEVVDRDEYDNVESCSMHDLVHDVAGSILGIPKVKDSTSDGIRYISGDECSHIPKEQAKWLRTLFYQSKISDIIFSNFKSLHALKLTSRDVKELPASIRELIHLRYLDISETRIRYLPDSIGELYQLQTFRAHGSGPCWVKLPSTIKYLFSLRHLHVTSSTELPPQMGLLTSLQTLPYFKVRNEEGHRIVELKTLKNLKGKLMICNLENVQGEEESKKACLFEKSGIVGLVLMWARNREESDQINDEDVLNGLLPPPNVKMLKIDGFKGARFPSWTLKMAACHEGLNNLMEIRLENCSECEEIPTLGHLPRLKVLYLFHLDNVKSIGSSFYGNSTMIVFPALERLEMLDMPNLCEWAEVEMASATTFPRLEYLTIKRCKQLRSAPSQFPCLREVEIEEMDSGVPLAKICAFQLTSLVKLEIYSVRELVCFPDWLFNNNQNLSGLAIIHCPKLRELPEGLQTLSCLERLEILECPNLESIPYSSGHGLRLLRELWLMEVGIKLPREIVESWAPSLNNLRLKGRVMNMEMIIDCLPKMSRLTFLEIEGVPKFNITSPGEVGSQCSLQSLFFSVDSPSWDFESFDKAFDGIILRLVTHSLGRLELSGRDDWECIPDQLQRLSALTDLTLSDFGIEELPEWIGNLSSLQSLYLYDCKRLKRLPSVEAMQRLTNLRDLCLSGMEDWESLPDQLQCLSALTELRLQNVGIEELPEWIGNLSSLQSLRLWNCERLKRLPSVEAMQHLTNLTYLYIDDCPLKERCIVERESGDRKHDSEWSKISHIPIILLGGIRI